MCFFGMQEQSEGNYIMSESTFQGANKSHMAKKSMSEFSAAFPSHREERPVITCSDNIFEDKNLILFESKQLRIKNAASRVVQQQRQHPRYATLIRPRDKSPGELNKSTTPKLKQNQPYSSYKTLQKL